jgi:hypothetical protein
VQVRGSHGDIPAEAKDVMARPSRQRSVENRSDEDASRSGGERLELHEQLEALRGQLADLAR